ncbi:unnamed protein product [Cuscuta europaea]|uniref:Uncharacterized protein n=1 Tax=Cuscuta europaea TaxID=41803 RepID=A0A9P0YW07_CUSEU|nr:unnamed protein product [Cuscuta europaea]
MRNMKTPEPNKGPIYIVHAPGERLSLAATPSNPWFFRTTGPRVNSTSLRDVGSDSHEAVAVDLINKKNGNLRKAFGGKMTTKIQSRS